LVLDRDDESVGEEVAWWRMKVLSVAARGLRRKRGSNEAAEGTGMREGSDIHGGLL